MDITRDGWSPTGILRFLEMPDGKTTLQYLWIKVNGRHVGEWRDVPTYVQDPDGDVQRK